MRKPDRERFAGTIAERARQAMRTNDGQVLPSWPWLERIAVALVLRDYPALDEIHGGMPAALNQLRNALQVRDDDELDAWISRVRALCVDGPDPDEQLPSATLPVGAATEVARHAKAALLHWGRAEEILAEHGIDPDASRAEDPAGALLRDIQALLQRGDIWAINTAHASGVPGRHRPGHPWAHTDRWCHTPGGVLPYADGHTEQQ